MLSKTKTQEPGVDPPVMIVANEMDCLAAALDPPISIPECCSVLKMAGFPVIRHLIQVAKAPREVDFFQTRFW